MKTAVILTAGLGSRLQPITLEMPKCFTEVHGEPIIEHTLEILEKNNVKEVVIVIGYLGNIIKKRIGSSYGHLKITYIENKIFSETNSMYSAYLARKYLENGAILIEGDTIFDDAFLKTLLKKNNNKAYWALDAFTKEQEGSMSIADNNGMIQEIKIVHGRLRKYEDNFYKSAGVLKITPKYGKKLSHWLKEEVGKKNTKIYYDLVIAKHLKDEPIYVCDIGKAGRWTEIDTMNDVKIAEKRFHPTKHVLILLDGAADDPIPELGNKSPFEYAKMPNLHRMTKLGKTGLMQTMYQGMPVGSIVANMGILGYNPVRYYPNGRASFEALAEDIILEENDIAFRCNLVQVKDGIETDFTSKNISDTDARNIIENLELPFEGLELYPNQSYRNILILRNAKFNASEIIAVEPHSNIGKPVEVLMLKGTTKESEKIAKKLNAFTLDSLIQIEKLNKKFKTPASMIALWSPSSTPKLASFHKRYGIDGTVVCGLNFMKGIGIAASMSSIKPKGATGYSDTDLKQKLKNTQKHITYDGLVYLHINAPDEEGHNKDVKAKVSILEKIDKELIGPLIQFMNEKFGNNFRIAVLPDHYTFLKDGTHSDRPVPYCLYGLSFEKDAVPEFSERKIEKHAKTIMKSYEFMDYFLNR